MLINSVNNNQNFKGIKLYHISKDSKTARFLKAAAKETSVAKEIAELEKQGMVFDFVREYDHEGQKTNNVGFYLGRKPSYFVKGKNPLYTTAKVTNADEAKAFVATIVEKAKAFLPKHLKKVEQFKKTQK